MRLKFNPNREYQLFLTHLRLARQEKGISQRELARRLQIHHSQVNRAEAGLTPLDMLAVRAYCRALQVPFLEFTRDLEAALRAAEVQTENDSPTDNDSLPNSEDA